MPYNFLPLLGLLLVLADDAAPPIKHQITGLFATDREADLREACAELPNIKLISIDFANAEATFAYDAKKAFPGAKPDQIVQRLDNLLRQASRGTFGAKPLRTLPLDKLQAIEIGVAGLDCKACALAAYESVYKLEGVERATASFRAGKVTALIDPTKTERSKLAAALRLRGVAVQEP